MLRSPQWIASGLGAEEVHGLHADAESLDVANSQTDSRNCTPGSIYFARVGEEADGHDYAGAAVKNGASALVVQRVLPDLDVPQFVVEDTTYALGRLAKAHLEDLRQDGRLQVAGITGSAGKTTTKDLLAQILGASGATVAPILSFNNEVGCPLTVLKADQTTRFLVLEMGASGRGHISYLTDIAPLDAAVELMVGRAHLGGFGSVEVLAASKQELLEGLVPNGTAILNNDDPLVMGMSPVAPGPVLTFSAAGAEDATFRATHVRVEDDGCPSFVLEAPDFRGRIRLQIAGAHQVSNALAAVACNYALDQGTIKAVRVLEEAAALSPHRMALHKDVSVEVPSSGEGGTKPVLVTVLDDAYNANPDSMAAAFRAAKAMATGRIVMVLGQMLELGEESHQIHVEVGLQAAEASPAVIVAVGEGGAGFLSGAGGTIQALHARDAEEALSLLTSVLEPGDFVLLKGSYGSGVWSLSDALVGTA